LKKLLTITCAITAFAAAPAFAASSADQRAAHKQAVKTCQQLHKSLTKAEFKALYGKNGVAHCVKKETQENVREAAAAEQTAHSNAAKDCKAERTADPAFQTQYGTPGKNGKNAFGKCVSQKAKAKEQALKAQDAQEDQNQVSAAKSCRDERQADPAAFTTTYGRNKNKKNAFGKCVSQKAHELNQQDEQEQPAQS
jgi:hypothetical protein